MTATAETTTRAQAQPLLALDTKHRQALDRIEEIAAAYALESTREHLGFLGRAIVTAKGIGLLREALSNDIMGFFMPLMNSPLGFKTDRPSRGKPQPYSVDEVRSVLVAAILNGVPLVGNRFNIISAQLYVTKEGYEDKVGGIDGLTDLEVIPGLRQNREGRTVMRMAVRWKLDGKQYELLDHEGKPGRTFEIPADEYSGPDQVVGKATRKALKAAWTQIMGSAKSLPDLDDEPAPAALPRAQAPALQSRADTLADAIGGQRPDNGNQAEPSPAAAADTSQALPAEPPPLQVNDEDEAERLIADFRVDIGQARNLRRLDQIETDVVTAADLIGMAAVRTLREEIDAGRRQLGLALGARRARQ